VRGGLIIEVNLRKDNSATVTLEEGAADFLAHSKSFGAYVRLRRIDVQWSNRRFTMPTPLSKKIAIGVTRNIIIRGAAWRISEDRIRSEMDHIDRLVIVDVTLHGSDAVVCTNSIHTAHFMKLCMMSRREYRGLRIEWFHDECADPLPLPAVQRGPAIPALRKPRRHRAKGNTAESARNMFALLTEDPTESSDGGSISDV
jgi:hypothetical protein